MCMYSEYNVHIGVELENNLEIRQFLSFMWKNVVHSFMMLVAWGLYVLTKV